MVVEAGSKPNGTQWRSLNDCLQFVSVSNLFKSYNTLVFPSPLKVGLKLKNANVAPASPTLHSHIAIFFFGADKNIPSKLNSIIGWHLILLVPLNISDSIKSTFILAFDICEFFKPSKNLEWTLI